ncbi:unnamed protein product [Coffea canephora]|uniref:Bet v I/Major latex protein domain-containing protein n=2 Tax=Coffea TaxID=13442 RepID=A0A068TTN5_COFCA|nr:S-norcoclaurine synthase 1-like [Coffea arabica]CDO99417.1 unnamed protein product [Coffea canephora]
MFGRLCEEIEIKVAANEAWKIFGALELGHLAFQQLSDIIHKMEVLEGDGGAGTVIKLSLPGNTYCKEILKVVDQEKRVKIAELIEGGFLDMGFTFYQVRIEVIENAKDENSCTVKFTIEYEVKEDAAANASLVSIRPYVTMMNVGVDYLAKNKNK